MDILSQYKQDHPKTFQEQKKQPQMTDEYGRTRTGMIAFVMRLSGGRIRDERRASVALLVISAIIAASALIIFFWQNGMHNALPKNFDKIDQSQYAVPK